MSEETQINIEKMQKDLQHCLERNQKLEKENTELEAENRNLKESFKAVERFIAHMLEIDDYKRTLETTYRGFRLKFENGNIDFTMPEYGIQVKIVLNKTENEFFNDIIVRELEKVFDKEWLEKRREGYTRMEKRVHKTTKYITIKTSPKTLQKDWEQMKQALKKAYERYNKILEGETNATNK